MLHALLPGEVGGVGQDGLHPQDAGRVGVGGHLGLLVLLGVAVAPDLVEEERQLVYLPG